MATKVGSVSNANLIAPHAHRPVYFFVIASSITRSWVALQTQRSTSSPRLCENRPPKVGFGSITGKAHLEQIFSACADSGHWASRSIERVPPDASVGPKIL